MQNNDSDSIKKFPSKSCPLRYGSAKIQEDASNLFQAALREYLGSHSIKQSGWGITGLSVSASKIIDVPSVRHQRVTCLGFMHELDYLD